MIEAMPEPHKVTAKAKPRPFRYRLVTAAVQTEGWPMTIATAMGIHMARHPQGLGPARPSTATPIHNSEMAARPSRRGPNRSTTKPVTGAQTTAVIDATAAPDMTCARLQPNSWVIGWMNRLFE